MTAIAREYKQSAGFTINTGEVKRLAKDMSPSQTSSRKPVGGKDPDDYYAYKVESQDNLQANMKKRRQQLSQNSSSENLPNFYNDQPCFQLKLGSPKRSLPRNQTTKPAQLHLEDQRAQS